MLHRIPALPHWFLIALALVPAASHSATFKCLAGGVASYQDQPCDGNGGPVELSPSRPDRTAAAAARTRAKTELRFVEKVEAERESALRAARADQEARDRERDAHSRRCASYVERAELAEADARSHVRRNRYKRDHERRARALRDRHFSECFAAG